MDMTVAALWHTFMVSAIGVFIVQKLKAAKWFPWAQQIGTAGANRVIAAIIALFGATGVTYVWNAQAHSLLLSGLSLVGIGTALWHWFNQFVAQEVMYQTTVNKPSQPIADKIKSSTPVVTKASVKI